MKCIADSAARGLFVVCTLLSGLFLNYSGIGEAASNRTLLEETAKDQEQWKEDLRYLAEELPRRHVPRLNPD